MPCRPQLLSLAPAPAGAVSCQGPQGEGDGLCVGNRHGVSLLWHGKWASTLAYLGVVRFVSLPPHAVFQGFDVAARHADFRVLRVGASVPAEGAKPVNNLYGLIPDRQ